jgi:hypothetical protein
MPTALVTATVVGLLVPALALAARRVIHGPAGGGSGTVDITLVTKHGAVTKLTRFEFNNIPATCTSTSGTPTTTATSGTFPHTIKVSSTGRFHASVRQNSGRVTYTVRGRFANPNKASGTLRIKGTVPGCGAADTGTVHWRARHN